MGNNRKANGKKRYHQGKYPVKNTDKYMGNPENVIYRSGWELKMFMFLDQNERILRWGSEIITIPYQDEKGKYHRYYPDLYYEIMIGNDPNRFERIVAEIKPYKETSIPVAPLKESAKSLETYEYQLKTYQRNLYKWSRAKNWCEKNQMKFTIIHEGHLKSYGIL